MSSISSPRASFCSTCLVCSLSNVSSNSRKNVKLTALLPLFSNKSLLSLESAKSGSQFLNGAKSISSTFSSKPKSPIRMALIGEEPEWNSQDYIAVGLAHCFVKDDNGKLQDVFVVEPIPAGALECMDNGGVTCYVHATSTNLGTVMQQDVSLLPSEFGNGKFCDDFEFRTLCASRTWKRPHPQENLLQLIEAGKVRSDWNFNVEDKRILNFVHEVNDSDNIKQDLSIDVYGRAEDTEAEVEKLYNV